MELQNKRALVTGATSGIGRETAILLAREGAVVIVAGRNAGNGARTVAATEANGGTAQFVAADVSDLQSVQRLANAAGEINILVNNAGAYPFSSTLEQDLASYEAIFDTNVHGTFFLTAALLPKMIAVGGGSIVNVTTIAGLTGILGTAVYGASKAAIDSTTRTQAAELGKFGIRVNAVAPGHTAVTRGYHLFAMSGNRMRVLADWALNATTPAEAASLGAIAPGSVPLDPDKPRA